MMSTNPLLVYLNSRTLRPRWQWVFTIGTLVMALVPLVVIAVLTRNAKVIASGIVVEAGFTVLLFPLGMALVGAMVSSTLRRKVGTFDLVRLTPLTEHQVLYALLGATFYHVRTLLPLLVGAIGAFLVMHPISDVQISFWLGYVFCVGLFMLNPIAALIGIGVGLRMPSLRVAPTLALGMTLGLLVGWAIVFWVAMERAYDAAHYHVEDMSSLPYVICIGPTPLILSVWYRLSLRFIRDAS